MSVRLAIGSDTTSSANIHIYTDSGSSVSSVLSKDYGASVQAVAIGNDFSFYAGGDSSVAGDAVRKYDADGDEITSDDWPINDFSPTVQSVAVDASNNVYVANLFATSIAQVRKYNSSGAIQNTNLTAGTGTYSIAVDGDGNFYAGGARTSSRTTRKYNSAGNLQWSADGTGTVYGITVDGSGNVYTVGARASSLTTRKYNSSGTLQWTADHGDDCKGVAVDGDGNVYTVGNRTSSITTRKYDSDGTEITAGDWPIDHGDHVNHCIFIDGCLYTTGARTSNITTRKYQSDGTLVWSLDVGDYTYKIAGVYYGELNAPALSFPIRLAIPLATITASPTSLPPGLALPFALRVPLLITDREDVAPGLSLNLALRLPVIRIEHPSAYQFADVYALYLGGVLLPFSGISCRRDAGGLNLTVTIPSASAALLAAVAANEGGTLRVLRGPRFPDGTVQLDNLWSATLDSWSYRAGAATGSITLQASSPTAIQAARPRTLRDISYTNTDQGTRRIRCRIDTYLSPGDVALLDAGQTMVVSDLTYSIQSGQAFMEARGF
jgi:hypothetical protein